MGEDLKKEFVEFLEALPEDKRNLVIQKLRQMDPASREEAIRSLVQANARLIHKENTQAGTAAETVRTAPAASPAPQRVQEKTKASKPEEITERPVRVSRKEETEDEEPHKAKDGGKHLKPSIRSGLIGAAAALAVGLVIFFGYKAVTGGWLSGKDTRASDNASSVQTQDVNEPASSGESGIQETEAQPSATPTPSEPTATPTPTSSPTPSPVPLAEDAPDLTGLVVVIDPGHQAETDEVRESVASWLSAEKPRCTSGCEGVATGVHEYELTLDYALYLENYLEQCGATVHLTRRDNDINISNQERAFVAIANDADVFIRLHADAANDSLTSGVKIYVPDSGDYASSLVGWGNTLGEAVAEAEGFEFRGTTATYNYTGLNYANSIPSFQIVMGYLSNSDDESVLLSEDNQFSVASAVADFLTTFIN